MTMLGAALYTGFFSAASLWLFLTSDAHADQDQADPNSRMRSVPTPVGRGPTGC